MYKKKKKNKSPSTRSFKQQLANTLTLISRLRIIIKFNESHYALKNIENYTYNASNTDSIDHIARDHKNSLEKNFIKG